MKRKRYDQGYNRGFDQGYDQAYIRGWEAGTQAFFEVFAGTSIIIPSYNQQEFLAQCVKSIQQYTKEPYEIIVIDNGSSDGTSRYLQSLRGQLRYKILKKNMGFAGGVNQGLMMARGETICFINNDTIVTENWLPNLLTCLYSQRNHGLVGPVTNYISGEQLIETSYSSMDEMHTFARQFNISDASKWKKTGRMTGFCVLMRREDWLRLAYFDEGFEVGNCEDDDFGLRARLLGLDLIIAEDTFIHHVGSVSMKSLGSEFEYVYSKNLAFFSQKWGDSHSLLMDVQSKTDKVNRMVDFYPSHVMVHGAASSYWVENGIRYPLEEGDASGTRISQIDLRNYTRGSTLSPQDIQQRRNQLNIQDNARWLDGIIVKTADGEIYQHERGQLRRIINPWTFQVWKLDSLPSVDITNEQGKSLPKGIPILPPPIIVQSNL